MKVNATTEMRVEEMNGRVAVLAGQGEVPAIWGPGEACRRAELQRRSCEEPSAKTAGSVDMWHLWGRRGKRLPNGDALTVIKDAYALGCNLQMQEILAGDPIETLYAETGGEG